MCINIMCMKPNKIVYIYKHHDYLVAFFNSSSDFIYHEHRFNLIQKETYRFHFRYISKVPSDGQFQVPSDGQFQAMASSKSPLFSCRRVSRAGGSLVLIASDGQFQVPSILVNDAHVAICFSIQNRKRK